MQNNNLNKINYGKTQLPCEFFRAVVKNKT